MTLRGLMLRRLLTLGMGLSTAISTAAQAYRPDWGPGQWTVAIAGVSGALFTTWRAFEDQSASDHAKSKKTI
jgi:hypothetical protein